MAQVGGGVGKHTRIPVEDQSNMGQMGQDFGLLPADCRQEVVGMLHYMSGESMVE